MMNDADFPAPGDPPMSEPDSHDPEIPPDEKVFPAPLEHHLMRRFATGATRNRDEEALAYEGFFSPLAKLAFAQYMHEHRKTPTGLREPDNWQNGIPDSSYVESMYRHFMDVLFIYDGYPQLAGASGMKEALCALFFNVQGLLHETVKREVKGNEA